MADIEDFLKILNDAYKADPAAIHSLFCLRIPCNETLAAHPSIVCGSITPTLENYYYINTLGIINGICEPLTSKRVAMSFTDTEPTIFLGFVEYKV